MNIRQATIQEIENWWDVKIEKQPNNPAYKIWKEDFVEGNKKGKYKTFFVFDENNNYVGQGSLTLKSEDPDLTGENKAEVTKLEINREFRGQKICTLIHNTLINYAKSIGIKKLTIGVDPAKIKNMQIYFHFGYNTFIKVTSEEEPPREPNGSPTQEYVLYYSMEI